jgi:phosphoadenosine phosphosulfate reductase
VVRWYLENIKWESYVSSKDLYNILINKEQLNPKTASGGLNSLLNMLENMPTYNKLKLGIVEKVGRERYIKKFGTNDVHPIAVLYSLYRYAISNDRYKITVSEFYREENKDGGPYLIFGIERSALENILRWLQENKGELIRVDLTADLDNINLSEDIKDYTKILEYY